MINAAWLSLLPGPARRSQAGQRHNTGGAADPGAIDHLVFTAGEALAVMSLATLDPDRARESFNLCYFGAL